MTDPTVDVCAIADLRSAPVQPATSTYIEGFIAARRYAKTSATHRRSVCLRFCEFVGDPAPRDLTAPLCLDWWATLTNAKPATASAYLKSVRQMLRHLRDIDVMEHDPLKAIRPPKVPRTSPRVLSPADVQKVIHACETPRDRCMVALMLGCGLRSVDVARLEVEDIDLVEGMMIVHGKGGHRDIVPMPSAVVAAVVEYLSIRGTDDGPLIISQRTGRALDSQTVQQRMNVVILPRAGVHRSARDGRGAHALRRTFASTLLDQGTSVRDVQILLRHQSLATTERYLRRPEAAQLRSAVETGPFQPPAAASD